MDSGKAFFWGPSISLFWPPNLAIFGGVWSLFRIWGSTGQLFRIWGSTEELTNLLMQGWWFLIKKYNKSVYSIKGGGGTLCLQQYQDNPLTLDVSLLFFGQSEKFEGEDFFITATAASRLSPQVCCTWVKVIIPKRFNISVETNLWQIDSRWNAISGLENFNGCSAAGRKPPLGMYWLKWTSHLCSDRFTHQVCSVV